MLEGFAWAVFKWAGRAPDGLTICPDSRVAVWGRYALVAVVDSPSASSSSASPLSGPAAASDSAAPGGASSFAASDGVFASSGVGRSVLPATVGELESWLSESGVLGFSFAAGAASKLAVLWEGFSEAGVKNRYRVDGSVLPECFTASSMASLVVGAFMCASLSSGADHVDDGYFNGSTLMSRHGAQCVDSLLLSAPATGGGSADGAPGVADGGAGDGGAGVDPLTGWLRFACAAMFPHLSLELVAAVVASQVDVLFGKVGARRRLGSGEALRYEALVSPVAGVPTVTSDLVDDVLWWYCHRLVSSFVSSRAGVTGAASFEYVPFDPTGDGTGSGVGGGVAERVVVADADRVTGIPGADAASDSHRYVGLPVGVVPGDHVGCGDAWVYVSKPVTNGGEFLSLSLAPVRVDADASAGESFRAARYGEVGGFAGFEFFSGSLTGSSSLVDVSSLSESDWLLLPVLVRGLFSACGVDYSDSVVADSVDFVECLDSIGEAAFSFPVAVLHAGSGYLPLPVGVFDSLAAVFASHPTKDGRSTSRFLVSDAEQVLIGAVNRCLTNRPVSDLSACENLVDGDVVPLLSLFPAAEVVALTKDAAFGGVYAAEASGLGVVASCALADAYEVTGRLTATVDSLGFVSSVVGALVDFFALDTADRGELSLSWVLSLSGVECRTLG